MSNISTIYDQVRSTLATLFADKTELVNPDDLLVNNVDLVLKNAFGVIIGSASPVPFDQVQFYELRNFTIVFTEEVQHVEGDKAPLITIKKNILEDLVTVKKDFLSIDQIGVETNIQIIELGESTDVSFIPNSEKFLTSSVTFAIGISETINT